MSQRREISSKFKKGEIVNAMDYIAHFKVYEDLKATEQVLSEHDKQFLLLMEEKITEYKNRDNKN